MAEDDAGKKNLKIERALVSVFDKTGLEVIVKCLSSYSIEIISSGGTAKAIRSLGASCIDVSDYTGYPESPDGLVKTLQPKIHGGLLLDFNTPTHREFMQSQNITPIDLVVVNLYPFTKVTANPNTTPMQAYEMIDIGGPAMVRASAKGALLHGHPCIIVNPEDYPTIVSEMEKSGGHISAKTIRQLAIKAFGQTAIYDTAIVGYLTK